MPVSRGEIWWVDFGIPRGSEQGGHRPAFVVQNDSGNLYSSTTIVAAITSRQRKPYPFHVEITARESGLPEDSTILLEQLLTVSQNRLVRRAGILSASKMTEVDKALRVSLGLSSL